MPGISELLIASAPFMVGAAIILAGIARLCKKLAKENNPTLGTYVNELGGYVIMGAIILILGIVMLLSGSEP